MELIYTILLLIGFFGAADAALEFDKALTDNLDRKFANIIEADESVPPDQRRNKTFLGSLECRDVNGGGGGLPKINLDEGTNFITIDPLGVSFTSVYQLIVDYEIIIRDPDQQNNKKITFICEKGTETIRHTSVVVVIDINDNAPVFQRTNESYSIEIDERIGFDVNASSKLIYHKNSTNPIIVTDRDGPGNNNVTAECLGMQTDSTTYSLPCDGYFRVQEIPAGFGKFYFNIYALRQYYPDRSYNLEIRAKNKPTNSDFDTRYSITQNVAINIKEVQDTPPLIDPNSLSFTMFEDLKPGERLSGSISAFDQDVNDPHPLRYRLVRPVSDNPQDQYAYNLNKFYLGDVFPQGINYNVPLYLNNSVDREDIKGKAKVLYIGIEAVEYDPQNRPNRQKGTASATIRININDVNDQTPTFSEDYYAIVVNEIPGVSANPDNTIQISNEVSIIVTDTDSDFFNQFKLGIVAGNINDNFRLDKEIGSRDELFSLYAKERILDHETQPNVYILQLQATDMNNSAFYSTVTVNVSITDINDHPPTFADATKVISIPEDTPVGTVIGSVTATDLDSGRFGTITSYEIIGNVASFSISPDGRIRLEQPLDYETVISYSFIVVAYDGGAENKLEGSISVNVLISNREDNAPEFLNVPYISTLFEDQTVLIPEIIAVAETSEADAGPMRYTITDVKPATVAFNSFAIGFESGELSVQRSINYKNTSAAEPGIVKVTIRAQAGTQSSLTIATITIIDLNNFPPEFLPQQASGKFFASINELAARGEVVIDLEVEDKDGSGDNGRVFFQIESGANDAFNISGDTGVITVANTVYLDRDKYQKEYTIVVVASDYGTPKRSSSATVFVEVKDSNNQNPVFESALYRFQIKADDAPGTVIGDVDATDSDDGAELVYTLDIPSVRFLKSFSQIPQRIDPERVLKVQPETGIITVAGVIEREVYDRINLNVIVEDIKSENQARQTATASVVIFILAANDTRIYFTNTGWTRENRTINLVFSESSDPRNINLQILTLRAFDPARQKFIQDYRKVESSDPGDYFQVKDSFVYIKKQMDYEALPPNNKQLSVTILALSNDGQRSANVTIIVTVRDLNDNAPLFKQPDGYAFEVLEGANPPTTVGRVTASDADSRSYGQVDYTIAGDQTDFGIYTERSGREYVGVIFVATGAVLDYETRNLYNLVVVAYDNPTGTDTVRLSTNVDVVIQLLDRNDQAPVCKEEVYNISVIGTEPVGKSIYMIEAIDGDAGINGQVTYFIQSATNNGKSYFNIETKTETSDRMGEVSARGSIYIFSSLERLPDRAMFELSVVAQDRGRQPLKGICRVIIIVSKGVQDLKPKWADKLPASVNITENQPPNTFVAILTAFPATIKSTIRYSFVGAGDARGDYTKFKIDPNTGEIRTTIPLDYEEQKVYSLLILATDSENDTLTNQYLLIVRVLDADDNLPSFIDCPGRQYTVPELTNVNEELPAPVFVYRALACDLDSYPLNKVKYSWFVDGGYCPDNTGAFSLNDTTGQIETKVRLDRESVAEYLLCVEASRPNQANIEKDLTSLNNSNKLLFIKVAVNDVNDLGPKFYEPFVKTVILQYPSADISVAEAYDLDGPPNNGIRYSIDNIDFTVRGKTQNAPTAFTINANDGTISIGTNDYTEYIGGYFDITVKAEDYNGADVDPDNQLQRVYVTDRANRIRVIFEEPADSGVDKKANNMINELNELYEDSGMYYEIETISYHVVSNNADPSFDKTDVCLVMVENDQVLSSISASKRLTDVKNIRSILSKYGAVDPGSCDPAVSVYPVGWESYWWVLVAFAIFIFVCCVILIFMVVVLYREYKQYMDSRKTYLVPGN